MSAPPKVMLNPRRADNLRVHSEHIHSNVARFMGWGRLAELLKSTGEILHGEELEAIVIEDDGIQLFINWR